MIYIFAVTHYEYNNRRNILKQAASKETKNLIDILKSLSRISQSEGALFNNFIHQISITFYQSLLSTSSTDN